MNAHLHIHPARQSRRTLTVAELRRLRDERGAALRATAAFRVEAWGDSADAPAVWMMLLDGHDVTVAIK